MQLLTDSMSGDIEHQTVKKSQKQDKHATSEEIQHKNEKEKKKDKLCSWNQMRGIYQTKRTKTKSKPDRLIRERKKKMVVDNRDMTKRKSIAPGIGT